MLKNLLPFSKRQRKASILWVFLLLFFALILIHSTDSVESQAPAGSTKLHRARISPSPPPLPPCLAPTLQTIYAPTVGVPEIANGRIVFNSRVDTVTDVQTTFYTEEGSAVTGPVVRVQPAEIRYVEIASLIPATQRWRVRWGGMSLSYSGKVFDIWAQITLLGALNSGSSDATFSVLNGRGSDTQQALWWMPRGGRAVIALGNSSDTSIHTQLDFSDHEAQGVDIAPHATEYIRLHPGGRNHSRRTDNGTGESVRLTTVGTDGSLKVAGLVLASDSRLVSSIRFYDTKSMVQQHLFATNMPLRGYEPHIMVSNTSDASVVAQPRFRPASGEGGAPVELPSLTLQPQEIIELDLNPLLAAAVGRNDLDNVSVEILNSGAPGSLIGGIFGTSQGTSETFELPLRDSGINRTNGGAYPWRIDGDYTTVASITNVGETTSRFVAQIYYQNGTYLFAPRDLALGETAFFDLKKIRDRQIPDANGEVLPRDVSIGQFRWHWFPSANPPHMIGRAAMVSASAGISASYSCMPNCGAHGPQYLIDGNTTVFAGDYETMQTREEWCGASGGCNTWNTNLSGSTVDNTSVANLTDVSNGWLNTNGLSAGSTDWWWTYWYGFEYDDGFDCRYEQDEYTGSEPADVKNPPDHLLVVSDSTSVFCTGGAPTSTSLRRVITYQVVDQYNNPISVPLSIGERFFVLNDHTCGAGAPNPSSCRIFSSGQFTDTLLAGCTPIGGSCGYDVLNQIVYCRSLAVPKPLGSLNEQVHADQITVNGNSTSLQGTCVYP